MPRRKRRPKPSEVKPGDELVAKLRKQIPKPGGAPSSSGQPRGYPATPRLLEEEDPRPPAISPMPSILREPVYRPRPQPRQVSPHQPDQRKQKAPPGPMTVGVPLLKDDQRVAAAPPPTPQVFLPEGAPEPSTEEAPATIDAPICPLLGRKCLHEWCEWWDGISSCHLPAVACGLAHQTGQLQGLIDWLHYRLGEHPKTE